LPDLVLFPAKEVYEFRRLLVYNFFVYNNLVHTTNSYLE